MFLFNCVSYFLMHLNDFCGFFFSRLSFKCYKGRLSQLVKNLNFKTTCQTPSRVLGSFIQSCLKFKSSREGKMWMYRQPKEKKSEMHPVSKLAGLRAPNDRRRWGKKKKKKKTGRRWQKNIVLVHRSQLVMCTEMSLSYLNSNP